MHRGACSLGCRAFPCRYSGVPNPLQNHFPRAYTMPQRRFALQTYYFVPTFARVSTKSTLLLPTCTCSNPLGVLSALLPTMGKRLQFAIIRPLYACCFAAFASRLHPVSHRLQTLLRICALLLKEAPPVPLSQVKPRRVWVGIPPPVALPFRASRGFQPPTSRVLL